MTALPLTLLLGLAGGCTSPGGTPDPSPSPNAAPTPLANLNTEAMDLARVEFCDLLPDAAVADALGGTVADTRHYASGDEAELVPGTVDVAHEFHCEFVAADGSLARAWVFDRPVSSGEATGMVRSAGRQGGCDVSDEAGFGEPGYVVACDDGGRVTAGGLVAETWLTCELSTQASDGLADRARAWCAQVINAINTTR